MSFLLCDTLLLRIQIFVFVCSLLYKIRVSIAPATPMNKPAGDKDSYLPIIYNKAPPIYDPATPRATVLINPKFSSPGTMLLAILPTNKPYTDHINKLNICCLH